MTADVVIVGAGAAGLATAIFARRAAPDRRVVLLDGAKRIGAKILVSGGSRCNVTNAVVTERDFWGGRRTIVRRILRAFPATEAVVFFRELGVALHEEADGKLFPDTSRARDVLAALVRGVSDAGAELRSDHRVHAIERQGERFQVATSRGEFVAHRVVIATGGQSLPKSGSDGGGFEIAQRLGHTIVATTPGLVPLVLGTEDDRSAEAFALQRTAPDRSAEAFALQTSDRSAEGFAPERTPADRAAEDVARRNPSGFPSGVSHEAEVAVWVDSRVSIRLRGALLWTHFGISGPVALNASRHWLRAILERRSARLTVSFLPGETFESVDARLLDAATARPKLSIASQLASALPASIVAALLQRLGIDETTVLAQLARDDRRRLVNALVEWPLPVTGSCGYNYAEVTAGGVALDEIDPATMASRVCPGLYLVGEILDVDGRIGGFNFQWAWSSAFVAGRALGRR